MHPAKAIKLMNALSTNQKRRCVKKLLIIICHEKIKHKLLVGTILFIYICRRAKRQSIEEKIHNTSEGSWVSVSSILQNNESAADS